MAAIDLGAGLLADEAPPVLRSLAAPRRRSRASARPKLLLLRIDPVLLVHPAHADDAKPRAEQAGDVAQPQMRHLASGEPQREKHVIIDGDAGATLRDLRVHRRRVPEQ